MLFLAFSLVCSFCCLLKYYQDFSRNQEEIKIELQKKVHRRICVRDITFSTAHPPFYVMFYCFFIYSPSQVTYLLNGPNKDTYCYGWYYVWHRKSKNHLHFNTSWLASLRTWYYFRLFLASVVLAMTLQ